MPTLLPAPNVFATLLYYIPTLAEVIVFAVLWKRRLAVPASERARYRANVLGYLAIVMALTGAVTLLIRWP